MCEYKMCEYALWLVVLTLIQLSLINLWFDSTLFSPMLQWLLRQKKDKWYTWFIFTLLTCPMCLGYWFAWFVAIAGKFLPGSPIYNSGWGYSAFVIFFTGLAISVLSRLLDGFMPEPVNQKLFVVEPVEESVVEEEKEGAQENAE